MRFSSLKLFILIMFITSFPLLSYAQGDLGSIFRQNCVSAWMKDTDKVTDKVSYKNFGEKYCNCMADKPMETDDMLKKSAQICMSQTLLHDTMETLESEVGLSSLDQAK